MTREINPLELNISESFDLQMPKRIVVWLLNQDKEILIRNINLHSNIRINELTVESYSLEELVQSIEVEWGIILSKDNLEYMYSFNREHQDNNISTDTYFLEMNVDDEEKEIITKRFGGHFINVSVLESILADSNLDFSRDTENFSSLFAFLFERMEINI